MRVVWAHNLRMSTTIAHNLRLPFFFKARISCAMATKHPHAPAIEAIGETIVRGHYNLSKRGWQNWRQNGVPRLYWKSLDLLALTEGKPEPKFEERKA